MENINDQNTLYFNNDDEFYRFCINPNIVIYQEIDNDDMCHNVFTANTSDIYNSCVKSGTKFIIKDPKSRILKNKCISYKTITIPIENVEPYSSIDI